MKSLRWLVLAAVMIGLLLPLTGPLGPAALKADDDQNDAASTDAATDEPTWAEQLDEGFGTYVTEPLWNYFIAVPLFRSPTVAVHYAESEEAAETIADRLRRPADREGGDLIAFADGAAADDHAYAVFVRQGDQEAAIAFLQQHDISAVADGETSRHGGIPFIVIVLLAGGVFFTLRFGLVHIRLFRHGFACILGRYDDPKDKGDITHFQALSSALSATVGLGNIAGVALAITLGGPGAVFWMWVSGFLGMSVKFIESTLSQRYRRFDSEGRVLGGPMVMMDDGLGQRGGLWKPTAKVMGGMYAIFIMCAAFGVALFQTKTSFEISESVIPAIQGEGVAWGFGMALAVLVGVVIIGGIPRIGHVAARLVPAMCVFYVSVCLVIILANVPAVPGLFALIFVEAFTGPALFGGFIGVLVMGMRRGMFSNEAGIGSAAIAHAAARTREPVREGLVAMLGPFIDTLVICTMTALAILVTGVHLQADREALDGAAVTADAFGTVHPALAYCLVPAVLVFAYSTMISWSYYGDRGAEYLLGERAVRPFRVLFVLLVLVGPSIGMANVLAFADVTFFAAAFPNIIAMVLLSGVAVKMLKDYEARLNSGDIQPLSATTHTTNPTPPEPQPEHTPDA